MSDFYYTPTACRLGKSKIEELAQKFAQHIGYEPGVDLRELVRGLNGQIQYHSFWNLKNTEEGSLVVEKDKSFFIHLPQHTTLSRDRFVIAHELGHFFLHFLLPRVQKNDESFGLKAPRYSGDQATDYEANWFAAGLLLPEAAFKLKYHRLGGDIVDVADHFGVGVNTAAVRARALGLTQPEEQKMAA